MSGFSLADGGKPLSMRRKPQCGGRFCSAKDGIIRKMDGRVRQAPAGSVAENPPFGSRAGVSDGQRHATEDRAKSARSAPPGQSLRQGFRRMPATYATLAVVAAAAMARGKADADCDGQRKPVSDGAKAVQLCLAKRCYDGGRVDACRGGAPFRADGQANQCVTRCRPAVTISELPTSHRVKKCSATDGDPRRIILDPALTVHTWLLLSTGIRAVDHCVEGVCSTR